MNEDDLKFLTENGYFYSQTGAITDGDGNYVDNVTIGERSVSSLIPEAEYTEWKNETAALEESGYEQNEANTSGRVKAVADMQIQNAVKDPSYENMQPIMESKDPSVYDEKYFTMEELENEYSYATVEYLRKAYKMEDSVLSEMEDEDAAAYMKVRVALDKAKLENPDIDTQLDDVRFVNQDFPHMNPMSEFVVDKLAGLVQFFTPPGAGIDDEEEKAKFLALKEQERLFKIPVAEKKMAKTDALLEEIDQESAPLKAEYERQLANTHAGRGAGANILPQNPEYNLFLRAKRNLEHEKTVMQDYVDDNIVPRALITQKNLLDNASLGIVEVAESLGMDYKTLQKVVNNEDLTPGEVALLKSMQQVMDIQSAGFEQNYWAEITGGAVQSLTFILAGWQGRVVGRVIRDGVVKGMIKKGKNELKSKLLGETLALIPETLLHADTYNYALDTYNGGVEARIDENGEMYFLTRWELYNDLKLQNQNAIAAIDDAIENTAPEWELEDLLAKRQQIVDADSRLKEPMSKGASGAHGIWETFKEVSSEKIGGKVMIGGVVKGGKWMGKKLNIPEPKFTRLKDASTVFSEKVAASRMAPIIDLVKKGTAKGNSMMNRLPGDNYIGNFGEEFVEEIYVQALPTISNSWQEQKEQWAELVNPHFYMTIAGQTALMKGGFSAFGQVANQVSLAGLTSEDRAIRKETLKELRKVYKKLGDAGLTQQEIDLAFIKAGSNKVTMTGFNNQINFLKSKEGGENFEEARRVGQDYAHQQVMAALQNGKLSQFKKSLTTASKNKKLDADTKVHIDNILQEIKSVESDQGNYLNFEEVAKAKSTKRFADRTLQDTHRAMTELGVDQVEVLEQLNSKAGTKDKTIEELFSEGHMDGMNLDSLSEDQRRYVGLMKQSKALNGLIENHNTNISKLTSLKYQYYLQDENSYKDHINYVNRTVFGGKMTAEEFNEYTKKNPNKKAQRDFTTQELNTINTEIYDEYSNRERDAAEKILSDKRVIKAAQEKADADSKVLNKEGDSKTTKVTPNTNTGDSTKKKLTALELEEHAAKEQEDLIFQILLGVKDTTDEDTPDGVDDDTENELERGADELPDTSDEGFSEKKKKKYIDTNIIEQLQDWAEWFKATNNRKPKFSDFWKETLSRGMVDKNHFKKAQIIRLALNWEAAGLGKSKWKKLYNKQYTTKRQNSIFESIFQNNKNSGKTDEKKKQEKRKNDKKVEEKNEAEHGINPLTGEVKRVKPVKGKTAITTIKAAYSSLKSAIHKKIIIRENGKVIEIISKGDVVATVPTLNLKSSINIKALLNINGKSQPGDTWKVSIADESAWDTPVLLFDEQYNEVYMSFAEWVKLKSDDREMTEEEFRTTQEFYDKVPMVYRDADNNIVSVVPDVDWYNPLNVNDPSIEIGENGKTELDLLNPSVAHKAVIEEGKNNTRNLRNQIIEGKVSSVKILTKKGSPPIVIPDTQPAMLLSQVAPGSKIVFFKVDTFYDTNNEPLSSDIQITNPDLIDKLDEAGNNAGTNSNYYLSPEYKEDGVTYYKIHPVLRKNEDGTKFGAFEKDIQTSKLIYAAHNMLRFPKDPPQMGMTPAKAKALQKLIHTKTDGLNIAEHDVVVTLIESLIVMSVAGRKKTVTSKDVPLRYKNPDGTWSLKDVSFKTALFRGGTNILQNTNLSPDALAITVAEKEGGFDVEIHEDYEKFLETRVFTTDVNYDVGEEGSPSYTTSVQPIITLEPIINETAVKPKTFQEKVNMDPTVKVNKNLLTKEQKKQMEEARDFLRENNNLDHSKADELIEDLDKTKNIEESLKIIEGLDSVEQAQLTEYMLSLISENFEQKEGKTESEFNELIKKKFRENFEAKKQESAVHTLNIRAIRNEGKGENEGIDVLLSNLVATSDKLEGITDATDAVYEKSFKDGIKKGIIQSTSKDNKADEIAEEEVDENARHTRNFDKGANEVIHKEKLTYKLKRIFSTISEGNTGVMGVPLFSNYNKMYNQIATFLTSPLPTEPTFEAMKERLEAIQDSNPWVPSLLEKLEKTDDATRAAFVSNMYKYEANASFVAFTKDPVRGLEGAVYFSNANNLQTKIKRSWFSGFKRGDITKGDYLNKEHLKKLVAQYESWGDKPWEQDDKVLLDWLSEFGINLSVGTFKDMKKGKLSVNRSGSSPEDIAFEKLFTPSNKRSNRLFTNLFLFAQQNMNNPKDLDFTTPDSPYNPFNDMGSILGGLLKIESHYNTSLVNITRRDGGKTVGEIVYPSYFLDTMNKLIKDANTEDKVHLKKIKALPFSEGSYLLNLLMTSKEMNSSAVFNYGEMGIMAMKDLNRKTLPMYSKIDEISPLDYLYNQRIMFQYMDTSDFVKRYKGFKMRVATMSTPTNSDKGRMMLMKMPVFDFFASEGFKVNEDGTVGFGEFLPDLVYEQLVFPELNRIVKYTGNTDIKGYNEGAKRFNNMPVLNSILSSDGKTSAIDFFKNTKLTGDDLLAEFEKQFKDNAVSAIEKMVQAEASHNLEKIGNNVDNKDTFNNSSYVDSQRNSASVNDRKVMAEMDYILNSYISNTNIMQLIAGDPALYYNSKDKNSTVNNVAKQEQFSKELGVNLGKRLALMIAPGVVSEDANTQKYIQLFMQDKFVVATNAEKIVGWHYGANALQEEYNGKTYQEILDNVRAKKYKKGKPNYHEYEQLQLRFSKVADYFNIESTDAQEYTTLREHLRIMVGRGDISKAKADKVWSTVYNPDGTATGKRLDKNDPDIQMILQPMKPVYTGSLMEDGVMRIMYVKSSSFPLIPDLVAGTELEPLMKKMNEIENNTGHTKTVRASYASANKVGGMNDPIDPFSDEDLAELTDLTDENNTPLRSKVLNGEDLKIQQDVPHKSDKEGDDQVSMGTQIFKLLFGDGMTKIKGFVYKGKTMTGLELKNELFKTFSKIVELNQKSLLDELGLDENMDPIDQEESIRKVHILLKKEAEDRNFSENDINALEIMTRELAGEKNTSHFKLPLWFSGNSNKFEAMLNAIIINRILKQKMPGTSSVVGSEAGMKVVEQIQLTPEQKIEEKEDLKVQAAVAINKAELEALRTELGPKAKASMLPNKEDLPGYKIISSIIDLMYDDPMLNPYIEDYVNQGELPFNELDIAPLQDKLLELYPEYTSTKIANILKYIKVGSQDILDVVLEAHYKSHITEKAENETETIFLGDFQGGVLKDNEVLAPSKLKVGGKLINLHEKNRKGEYIYLIPHPSGKGLTVNPSKISKELLESFSFRTPTSSHGSAASVKIVGLLPQVYGDLMITPANFVTQMGQDFDVDKLTGYAYHHYKDKSGRLVRLNEGHKEKKTASLRKELERLQDTGALSTLKGGSQIGAALAFFDQALIDEFGLTEEELYDIITLEDADLELKIKMAEDKHDLKMAQNDFIEIHHAVYNNPDAEVQKKINKVLSMDVAKDQASQIDDSNSSNNTLGINLVSPTYQMEKLISGSTGSSAIGVYAKGVTFNSLVQQLENPLYLMEEDGDGGTRPKRYVIGGMVSTGIFGVPKAISKDKATEVERYFARSVTEIMDERVNTATDNEKAQILGRVGITHIDAIAVDNLLALLGVDLEINRITEEEYDPENKFHRKAIYPGNPDPVYLVEYNIPYLLHSQPIVKEYFRRLKDARAMSGDTVYDAEKTITEELLGKDFSYTDKELAIAREEMVGDKLIANIQNGTLDSMDQKHVLLLYKELISDAQKVKDLQAIVDMTNIGKSMWELKDKIQKFEDLKNPEGSFTKLFNDPLSLLGKMTVNGFEPTTNQGVLISTVLDTGKRLFFNFFPYYDPHIEQYVNYISQISEYSGKEVDFKQTVFAEMKRYISTNPNDRIFTVSPHRAREILFFHKNGNTSLSNYLGEQTVLDEQDLSNSEFEVGLRFIKENLFIEPLAFDSGVNGNPDLVRWDNTEAASVEEDYHTAFRELFIENLPLPDKNGMPYSTRMLAQELVAYSYLSGGIVSGAIEFHKFIPLEYYEDLTFTETTSAGMEKKTNTLEKLQGYDTMLTEWGEVDMLGRFMTQFYQNNPENAPSLPKEYYSKGLAIEPKDGGLIVTSLDKELPEYISKRVPGKNKNKQGKWKLFKRKEGGVYEELPVLGSFGMAEYDFTKDVGQSNIEDKDNPKGVITPPPPGSGISPPSTPTQEITIKTDSNVTSVLREIAGKNFAYNNNLGKLAQTMLDLFGDKAMTTRIVTFTGAGRGSFKDGVLKINLSKPKLAETFLHEFIHSVSSEYINEWVYPNGELVAGAPSDIVELNEVFKQYRDTLSEKDSKYSKDFASFKKRWDTHQNNQLLPKEERTKVDFTEEEMSIFYPAMNLKEFLAVPLSNNVDFLKITKTMKYKTTSLTLAQKLAKVFQRILNTIAGKENEVGKDLLHSTLSFIEIQSTKYPVIKQKVNQSVIDHVNDLIDRIGFGTDYLPDMTNKTTKFDC